MSRSVQTNSMNRLLIVGAGNFGREVLQWAMDVPADRRHWEVGGFLDSRGSILDGFNCAVKILGDPLTFELSANDRLICAIGDPRARLDYCRRLKARGAQFTTLIHPTAIVGFGCRIGEGCILCPGTILTTNVTLGNFVMLNVYATVGHDAIIGDGCTLSGHSEVTGRVVLGEGVFLGSHAAVLPTAKVGDYATVGAGSVVLCGVAANTTVIGVPAKPFCRSL